jgi:hypothetical protein
MDHVRPGELVSAEVRAKLDRLRRALSLRLLLEGLAWLALALVAVVFVTLGFDYLFRLERDLRGAIMLLAVAGMGVVVWRQLVAPLRVPMDAPELALLVERRFGQLGDRLIGAIQFSRRGDCEQLGVSMAMVARMAEEAHALAAPLPFRQIVERRGVLRSWAFAGGAGAVLLLFGLWQGELLRLWFHRNVLFADVPWPQSTYLTVRSDPPEFTVLRGDDLTVIVEVETRSRAVPDHVTFHARYAALGWTEETAEADRDEPRKFVKVFPAVSEEFELYVTGGDDRRDKRRPHKVRLIDPPGLLDVEFVVRYPSYMRPTRPDVFPGGTGALPVPIGAKVTVQARANKPLSAAAILLDEQEVGRLSPQNVSRAGQRVELPLRYLGEFEIVGKNKPVTKVLRFALTDEQGHSNRRGAKYMVQVQPDHRPMVDLKKLGIGVRISPRAVLPLQLGIKDDWGLAAADVRVRMGAASKDANTQPVALPPDAERQFEGRHDLDLEPLKLSPGGTVYVSAQATDTLPEVYGGPNVGESSPLSFSVVKPEDLMEEFLRRQKEIRLEFVQAIALQESARAKTATAGLILARGTIEPEVRRLLLDSGGIQQNVGAEVSKAADSLAAILEEMKNNRLGTDSGREQIRSDVVKPLRDLEQRMRKVTAAIQATRKVDQIGDLKGRTGEIEQEQAQLLDGMDKVLQRMVKLESKQELANKLQIIIEWSQQLLESIRKKEEAEVGKVLQPATRPATRPAGGGR